MVLGVRHVQKYRGTFFENDDEKNIQSGEVSQAKCTACTYLGLVVNNGIVVQLEL